MAMVASMLLHIIIFFGVTFQFPQPKFDKIASSLEVVLVNNKTLTKPKETELLAQDNLYAKLYKMQFDTAKDISS